MQIIQENNLLHSLGNEGHISGTVSEENLEHFKSGTAIGNGVNAQHQKAQYGEDTAQNKYIDQQMISMRQSWLENQLQNVTREVNKTEK